MIGIIPAAGKGTRLSLPFSKELLPLLDRDKYFPVIQSSIEAMIGAGINKIIVIVNHTKSDLIKFLGNGSKFNINIFYAIQEEARSLPEALLEAVKIVPNEEIVFLMPDTIISPDNFLRKFLDEMDTKFIINLGCLKTKSPHKFAMVSEVHSVVDFMEEKNPKSKLSWMWGFWHWKPEFSNHLINYDYYQNQNDFKEITLSHVANEFMIKKQIFAVKLSGYLYRDLGTFDEINDYLSSSLENSKMI